MKQKRNFYRTTKRQLSALALSTGLVIASGTGFAQSISDYSVLPETFTAQPDRTPNIMIVLDNSGSMRWNNQGVYVGAHAAGSRSREVRQAFRDVLSNNEGQLNVGLMMFGGDPYLAFNGPFGVSSCNDFPGCGTGIPLWGRTLTGLGALVSNLEPLDSNKINEINALIATEPQLPTLSGTNYFNESHNWGYFESTTSPIHNGVIMSQAATPLRGALQSAQSYLFNRTLASNEIELPSGTVQYPQFDLSDTSIPAQCRANTYVFLLTDGLPNTGPDGSWVGENQAEVTRVANTAAQLRANGIETWVFGFALNATATNRVNQIANAGSLLPDGTPRGGFFSATADQLRAQLEAALSEISRPTGSSSGISVISSSTEATGSVVQGLYTPQRTNTAGDQTVYWTGALNSFFLDRLGYLREDANNNAQLDDYGTDPAFNFFFDDVAQETRAYRLDVDESTGLATQVGGDFSIEDLDPIWEAGEILSGYDQSDAAGKTAFQQQRDYDDVASTTNNYRHIFTWIEDDPGAGDFDNGDVYNFVWDDGSNSTDEIGPDNYTILGMDSNGDDVDGDGDNWDTDDQNLAQEKARNLVHFIRGEEGIPGARLRTLDNTAYLLSDIIHSSATQVDAPNGPFDALYGADGESYAIYKQQYADRRRMVYVGSNGGMLHAFNSGFWDSTNRAFERTGPGDSTNHELGAEVWAYVPMNLLPHLQFLQDPAYNSSFHVGFVDGPVQSFDIQAFNSDSTHPDGWGTIIVAGMYFGGGAFEDVNYDPADPNRTFTARSAYIVLDVTDPTEPPEVIGEITHPNLGFTTSKPTVMKEGDDWYLVMGSGPTEIADATSTQRGRILRYRLNEGSRGFDSSFNGNNGRVSLNDSFIGDLTAKDWDLSFTDDAVYFGVSADTPSNPDGGMFRYVTSTGSLERLFDTNQPVTKRPLVLRDEVANSWVFFGTGRLLDAEDFEQSDQNSFYGIKEPVDSDGELTFGEVSSSDIVDVSDVDVDADDGTLIPNVEGQTTFNELKQYIQSEKSGWQSDYEGASPSARTPSTATSFRNFLFYTGYFPPAPDGDLCTNEFGESFLYAVDMVTGTAFFSPDFEGLIGTDTNGVLKDRTSIGFGISGDLSIIFPDDPGGNNNNNNSDAPDLIIKAPLSTGEIASPPINLPSTPSGRKSWTELEFK